MPWRRVLVTRRIDEAARAMEATVTAGAGITAPEARCWTGAAIDSRQVRGGELFFALEGSRADGHRFVPDALAAGAAAAVVRRGALGAPGAGELYLAVEDPLAALHALTRAVRREVPRHLLGLTGSAGKTTTKELLAILLARRFRVAKSPGNLNNLLGFPLALLGIPEDTDWMVAEMGMSTPGELGGVSRLARPDVALLLNVRPVHLEFFGTLAAIAEAKAEILEGLAPDGLLVANADDAEVRRVAPRHPGRIVWFGWGPEAEVRGEGFEALTGSHPGSRFTIVAGGERLGVELPLLGRANADNALAAAACAWALGVPLAEIAAGLAEARPAPGRGEVHALLGGVLVDDSYNSNPEALSRSLEAVAALDGKRHWAVLGDMLELGPGAPAFHRRCGEEAGHLGFSPVVGVGELARELVAGAAAAGAEARWLPDAAAAARLAATTFASGDVVLVKGSRGVRLDVVVEKLLGRAGGEAS
ncbi:MAG TPA: UDP-N-acetylmuramoyl-tripeptide--D-alanyl-D-alanine ligase [Thermoanaerobaculia bacterium]|nr:UDP-N-acetylmuramoyl-tripeptide--D-alanyl-D-alanine ligase [Thermoanaerobaculia bacterium]